MSDSEYLTLEEYVALEEQIYQRRQARIKAARQAEKDYWRDDTNDIETVDPQYTDAATHMAMYQERTR